MNGKMKPTSKAEFKKWQKQEKAKQEMIFNAFRNHTTTDTIIACQETTEGGKDETN